MQDPRQATARTGARKRCFLRLSCHAAFRRAWPASASVPVTLADSETDPRIAALAACSSHATGSLGLLRPGLVLMVADGRPHPGRGRVTSVKVESQRAPLFELRLPPFLAPGCQEAGQGRALHAQLKPVNHDEEAAITVLANMATRGSSVEERLACFLCSHHTTRENTSGCVLRRMAETCNPAHLHLNLSAGACRISCSPTRWPLRFRPPPPPRRPS